MKGKRNNKKWGLLPMGGKDGQKEMDSIKETSGSNIDWKSTEAGRLREVGKMEGALESAVTRDEARQTIQGKEERVRKGGKVRER